MSAQLSTDQYLTHYWSTIENGTMFDQIGSAHMTQGNFTSFIEDRFACANSALALNGGWTQVPSGIYFDTPEFSISVWVLPLQVGSFARVIDFGNGHGLDNILLTISSGSLWQPTFDYYLGSKKSSSFISSQILNSDQWNMITITFNETNFRIYINETLQNDLYQNVTMTGIQRSNCYIGKSNFNGDGVSGSYLDDLRFYNKSLTQEEIIELMNQKEISKYIYLKLKLILLFKTQPLL